MKQSYSGFDRIKNPRRTGKSNPIKSLLAPSFLKNFHFLHPLLQRDCTSSRVRKFHYTGPYMRPGI